MIKEKPVHVPAFFIQESVIFFTTSSHHVYVL